MKKATLIFFIAIAQMSCSSDSPSSSAPDQEMSFSHYTHESIWSFADAPGSHSLMTGNIVNNKMHSHTYEYLVDGVSQGELTVQRYFHENGRLVKTVHDNDVKHFYYNAQGELAGITWEYHDSEVHYRAVYQESGAVLLEKINLPYDDPAATVIARTIVFFDSDDNIISAGRDINLDGEGDYTNTFSYVGNNLVSVQRTNAPTINYEYSNIIDTKAELFDNTYGKKLLRLLCAEVYGGNFNNVADYNLGHSRNLTAQGAAASDYAVLPNQYFSQGITTTVTENSQQVLTVKYYFN